MFFKDFLHKILWDIIQKFKWVLIEILFHQGWLLSLTQIVTEVTLRFASGIRGKFHSHFLEEIYGKLLEECLLFFLTSLRKLLELSDDFPKKSLEQFLKASLEKFLVEILKKFWRSILYKIWEILEFICSNF